MDRIVLCTANPGKVAELRALLPGHVQLLSLADVGVEGELPETGDTLEANAIQKARHVYDRCGIPCVADDTGLEVDALGGAPGVYSARYAGEARDARANMALLLQELGDAQDRRARFRTVVALVDGSGARCFHGVAEGRIVPVPRGLAGFGYDPVFVPEGHARTFAEMSAQEKNTLSHRARAVRQLVDHLA